MVKDRSSEFRRKAKQFSPDDISISIDGGSSAATTATAPTAGIAFFAEIDEIRNLMGKLADDVASMKMRQRSILAQTIVDGHEKDQLDECIAGIRQRSGLLRGHLMAMQRAGSAESSTGVNERIRRYHIEALSRKLSDLLEMFNAAQLDYRAQVSKRIKRQLDIAGEFVTAEEVNAMVDSKSPQVFNRDVRSLELKSALDDASSRHNEILNLEASIKELSDLYSDLAFMVHAQGETVDRIDRNVGDATDYVMAGNQQARVAVQYRAAELRKKLYCGGAIALIIVILIIILIIYFSTR